MKHLAPNILASLADGAPSNGDAQSHLRACATCRAELKAMRELCQALGQAPAPASHLRQATFERLGLRPRPQSKLLRWAWAPALGAIALALWLPRKQAPMPSPGPDLALIARAPKVIMPERANPGPAQRAQAPAPLEALAAEATLQAQAQEAAKIGNVETPPAKIETHARELKAEPMPGAAPELKVLARNNLIRPGVQLSLTIELPEPGQVSAQVFDARGRLIETLYQGPAGPGPLFLHWDAAGVPSAVYTILLKSGSQSKQIKAVVAR